MTGYSSASVENISIEVKSVNHRFFEFGFHCPFGYSFLEDEIRTLAKKFICRGKVDVHIRVEEHFESNPEVKLNWELASKYVGALEDLRIKFGVSGGVSAFQLLTLPNMTKLEKPAIDEEAVMQKVLFCAKKAFENLNIMKETEGKKLKADIKNKLSSIFSILESTKKNSFSAIEKYRNRLEQNIKSLLNQNDIEACEQRILTEVAIFADKVSIDEEIVRLESHLAQMDSLLSCEGSIGKKMDFIVQEMNRETNTIGSKCSDIFISQLVIEAKALIENIREQVQNVE